MSIQKLQLIAEEEGFENYDDLLQEYHQDNTVPGICMNEGCTFIAYYEPDQDKGHCDICGTKTVQSCLILGGIM